METEEEEVKDKEVREGGVKVKEEEEDKGKEVEEDFPTEEEQEGEMLTVEAAQTAVLSGRQRHHHSQCGELTAANQ